MQIIHPEKNIMDTTEIEILKTILHMLETDATLSQYVKSFTLGENDISRKLYPFINVGNMKYESSPLSIGKHGWDRFDYTIEITGGVSFLLPKTAFSGDDGGRMGILQLREDIMKVIRPNDFGGIFWGKVEVPAAVIGYKTNTGGTDWITSILISGSRRDRKIVRSK
jgi:hypothetical protein